MHQYYQGNYWNTGLEERVRDAATRLGQARERLDRSRARLTELPESRTIVVERPDPISPKSSYRYQDPRMRAMAKEEPPTKVEIIEIVVRGDAERHFRLGCYTIQTVAASMPAANTDNSWRSTVCSAA